MHILTTLRGDNCFELSKVIHDEHTVEQLCISRIHNASLDQERYQVGGDGEVHLATADSRGHGSEVLTEPSNLLEMIMMKK